MEDDENIYFAEIADLNGNPIDEDSLSEEELKELSERLQEYLDMISACNHEFQEKYEAELGNCLVCEKCGVIELMGLNH